MRLDEMEITSFTPERSKTQLASVRRYERVDRAHRRPQTRAGGMLAKIGFCLAVLAAAVLIQNFVLTDGDSRAVVEASTEEKERENGESEDVLGRLRFVEAGGAKSVFAVSQRWSMPVASANTTLMEEDTLLQIIGKAGDTVSVSAAGEVRAIAYDDRLGACIRVHHGSDLESVYYNVKDIRVEVGQPLLAGDTLGEVGDTGMLYVAVTQSGEPQLPAAYLDVAD